MPTPVILPKLGMTMEDATILRWIKREGEKVSKDEPLLEIMTDKVEMQVEAPAEGILRSIRAQPGEVVPVAQVIAYIVAPGEDVPSAVTPIPVAAELPSPAVSAPVASPLPKRETVAATPAARRVAREKGIELSTVVGTGPGGSITEADVHAALTNPAQTPGALAAPRHVAVSELFLRAREVPHIYLRRTVDLSGAVVRGQASYTAITIWAVARGLHSHPILGASLSGETLVMRDAIDIGVLIDAPEGIITPVIRNADRKDFQSIHREVEDFAHRAHESRLTSTETQGSVFTVANLGMFGVDQFSVPVIPPQVALLALGAVRPRPWPVEETVKVRPICELTLALDHRVVDGVTGARFLQEICQRLEALEEWF
jgi:pyruvate dehydrogenase E2 component (dihydrolipoamide acetyltransferase)